VARRRRKSGARLWLSIGVAVALAASAWFFRHRLQELFAARGTSSPLTVEVSGARVDPVNEGRRVRVSGNLEVASAPRDAELGIHAQGAVLLRKVEMYQWLENCSGDDCRYATDWSERPVDSRRFRHPEAHDNPSPRLTSAKVAGAGLKVGAYAVGADLVAAQVAGAEFPVRVAELPPNLAASFADAGGALYAGGDPAHPKVGELRISYRVVPLGPVALSGVQREGKLAAE
jgi:hypothetical protein